MSSRHHYSKKDAAAQQGSSCRLFKEEGAYPEKPAPSGICNKCQTKIGVILLILFVIAAGMVFVGLI